MSVPQLDLKAQYQTIKSEIDAAIADVVASQHFILGEKVKNFEREMAEYYQIPQTLGVASGSDALLISLRGIDLQPGDEVITCPLTFIASGSMITLLGAVPVFIDIDPATYTIDVNQIEKRITSRTKAILPIHLYGQPANMTAIMKIAQKHHLFVIEDACQAVGAKHFGRNVGTIGNTGTLSFFPSKNLGGYGDGGMVLINHEADYEKLRKLRTHGGAHKYYNEMLGYNSRLDAIQAAILSVKLKYLDQWNAARRKRAYFYNELFKDVEQIITPVEAKGNECVYHQYTIRVPREKREPLFTHLKDKQIGVQIYFPVPLHLQQCFAYLGYKTGDLPEVEKAVSEIISLPIYPEITDSQQEEVAETIINFLG